MISKSTREIFLFVIFAIFVIFVVPPQAQEQTTEDVEVVPIECWSRTSANAVRIGEQFGLVLTCAVLESTSTIVVPDETVLDPAALQLPPFDVVGGTHPDDVRTSSRRFFQYEYTLRLIGETFDQDVTLPALTVTYRVQSRTSQGGAVEGREREYILPSRPIRILSLVPTGSMEIRDPATPTFGVIQQRRLRASALRIGSVTFFVMSGALVLWALAGALRKDAQPRSTAPPLPSDGAVLRQVRRELDAVRRERVTSGWTPDGASRALRALRAAATLAASRKLAHVPTTEGVPADGQLLVRSGWPRSTATLVSGSAGADRLPDTPELADFREALERLTTAAYGREAVDDDALDAALSAGEKATERLARQRTWLRSGLRRITWRR